MSTGVAIGLAVAWLAATTTSLGWLMKSRGARASAAMSHRRPWHSLRALFASRWFAGGILVASVGGILHVAALALAPISSVQAVMATGIVVLGVMAERLFGWPVLRRQWTGVLLTVAGLALLAVSAPAVHGAHSSFATPTMIAFDVALVCASLLLLLAPRLKRLHAHDGALIGAASGALFGLCDIAIKALVGATGNGIASLLVSPWILIALTSGLTAQYVSARSLQTGDPLSVSALTGLAVNIANIAGGILVFGDPIAPGLTGSLIEGAAFLLICAGAFLTPVRAEIAVADRLATRDPASTAQESNTRTPRGAAHATPTQDPDNACGILPGALATLAATLLLASEISDEIEGQLGLNLFSLGFALTAAIVLVSTALMVGYDVLRWPRLQSHTPSRAKTTSALLWLGLGALTLIAIEHLHHPPPPTDGSALSARC